MARFLNIAAATALAMAIAAPAMADPVASAPVRPAHHHWIRAGDIVVHARHRSYLDAGPTGGVGTGNRYVTDTSPASYINLGMPFTAHFSEF
jgi:hypothetical protein